MVTHIMVPVAAAVLLWMWTQPLPNCCCTPPSKPAGVQEAYAAHSTTSDRQLLHCTQHLPSINQCKWYAHLQDAVHQTHGREAMQPLRTGAG
jgi:hypothetical protein